MNTYVALVSWTQKGIQEFRDSPSRVEKAKAAIAAAGGEMKSFYLTLGRYDMIAVFEAPDDAAYATPRPGVTSRNGPPRSAGKGPPSCSYNRIPKSLACSIVKHAE